MADTYEKDLAQKSSLTVNDFIRVVGTDNVSYKQLVSDVAKKIIENYTGSSLAGSSQSVKSALDALNSKLFTREWRANADLNTFTDAGVYWISQGATNAPPINWYPVVVLSRTDTIRQIAISGGNAVYTRAFQSSSWTAWVTH